ncbi:MAG: transpeptidase family protein [Bacteroides sp.]|nr:transpeptidase family protein [Bacteroides sp.]
MTRYFFVVLVMSLMGVAVVVRAAVIMFAERDYWEVVANRFVTENDVLYPNRGNILSADGKLMASSLPEYTPYIDYKFYDNNNEERRKKGQAKKDSVFFSKLDSICVGLHKLFPEKSVAAYKAHLKKGRYSKTWQHYPLLPDKRRRISYTQYKRIKELPYFNLGVRTSGLHDIDFNRRKRPFGSLASRTLGDVYPDTALGAKNGIELAFDTLLKGQTGVAHKQKVMNRYLPITDKPPVDGYDIVTTIDVDMQDICEKALVDKLKELQATVGVAVLMEVKTGEVKAIVNMTRGSDGNYYEMRNNAISDMMEPGSTFKTASIMVALEDGHITPETEVETGKGVMPMYGRQMRDHNWRNGGYGKINVTRIMEVSSNIGVSYLIDKYYKDDPQRFVDGLHRMSIHLPLHLQIPGEGTPNIRGPKERYFSKTTLPWMSIGYATQIPPINTLTFYNAIANDGVMVRPKFVKAVMKDGNVLKEYPTEVINPQICSDRTLTQIRHILRRVVSNGLGKYAGSKQFAVSGKTGTAQVAQAGGYKTGTTKYLVSFCGYFPSESPEYSCIVAIQKTGLPASGGTMAGSVFGKIAERVYAKKLFLDIRNGIDSTTNVIPEVRRGEMNEASLVLRELEVPTLLEYEQEEGSLQWGYTEVAGEGLKLHDWELTTAVVPDVTDMGAKDAVYLLEKCGLKVHLQGCGRVKRQSLPPGSHVTKGQTVSLTLVQ